MKEKKVSKWMREHKMSIFVIVSAVVMLIGLSYALTETSNWYSEWSEWYHFGYNAPWLYRGGSFGDVTTANQFYLSPGSNGASNYSASYSFRLVLSAK